MHVLLWILAGLLAASFFGAGLVKLTQPRQRLEENGMEWVEDFSTPAVQGIGALEVLAAVGLIVPPLVGIAPWLVIAAAVGLVALMVGALVVHLRRGETNNATVNISLVVVAAALAVGRVVVPF